jgi:D-alanine-D-alanine ligase
VAKSIVVSRKDWFGKNSRKDIFKRAVKKLGLPFVIRPANQGSSIGVSIVHKKHPEEFAKAMNAAFFTCTISRTQWSEFSDDEKVDWVRKVSEIKDGIGIPFIINDIQINHPEELLTFINNYFAGSDQIASLKPVELLLQSIFEEQEVLIEEFIEGIEFSCIVIRNENGKALALPPTEIKKGGEVFDYRSKYLAGMSRKVTPIGLPDKEIERIRKSCERLFDFFGFHVYARIDCFRRKKDKKIFLNDPNTTSGMLPSSFFFHQAAEIGLNPSQFLTYIIRTSLDERIHSQSNSIRYRKLLSRLDDSLVALKSQASEIIKIAVILGGYSSERHISVESGRNIFENFPHR